MSEPNLIPSPQYVEFQNRMFKSGGFALSFDRNTVTNQSVEKLLPAGNTLCSFIRSSGRDRFDLMNEESYLIVLDTDDIKIYASSGAGWLYGAVTLLHIYHQYDGLLPAGRIYDYPVCRHRAVQLTFAQEHVSCRPRFLADMLTALAKLKINACYLYLESYIKLPCLADFTGEGAMTPEEARALVETGKQLNIEVIPALNLMGHNGDLLQTQRYRHLMEPASADSDMRIEGSAALCATNPEVRELAARIISETCDIFDSEIIHVGGDEVENLGKCPLCHGKDPLTLYVDYFGYISDLLKARGRRMGIWGDILVHYGLRDFKTEADRVIERLKENTVIFDWCYDGTSQDTLRFFTEKGFTVVASSATNSCYAGTVWYDQRVSQFLFFADAVRHHVFGGLITDWINMLCNHAAQYELLFATGAQYLWSGTRKEDKTDRIDRRFSFQKYGIDSDVLTNWWAMTGDPGCDVLRPFTGEKNGSYLRHCVYYTDNPLFFWIANGKLLSRCFDEYSDAVDRLGSYYHDILEPELRKSTDPYAVTVFRAPLIIHRQLQANYRIISALYEVYDRAALLQFSDRKGFYDALDECAALLDSFIPLLQPAAEYAETMHRIFGTEKASGVRVRRMQENTKFLADYILHFKNTKNPLPSLPLVHTMVMERAEAVFWIDRAHDFIGDTEFVRYAVTAPRSFSHVWRKTFNGAE